MQEMQEALARSLGPEDRLEKEMTTRSSILVWRIPWAEKPGGLWSVGRKESDTTERLSTVSDFSHLLKQCLDLFNIS